MEKKKIVATGILAALMAVSGQFVQVGPQADATLGMQSAQAFGIKMPKIGGGSKDSGDLGSAVKEQAQKAGKDAVSKQLGVDLESMGNHRDDMLKNLAYAARMEAIAAARWSSVANVDTARAVAASNAATSFAKTKDFSKDAVNNFKATFLDNMSMTDAEKASFADLAVSAKDRLTQQENQDRIIEAKKARKLAAIYNGLAARNASMLLSQSAKALASAKDTDDILTQVQDLSEIAKTAQSFIDAEKKISKERSNATKKAEKASNVKEPTKDEYEAFGKEKLNEMM